MTFQISNVFISYPTFFVLLAIGCIAGALIWAVKDYRSFIAFGTGGISPDLHGWWLVTSLRIWLVASRADLKDVRALESSRDARGFLGGQLKDRGRERPRLAGRPLPQRQITTSSLQPLNSQLEAARRYLLPLGSELFLNSSSFPKSLLALLPALVAAHPHLLHLAPSSERSSLGLYATPSPFTSSPASTTDFAFMKGEIAHVHGHDRSLHVVLSPKDAAEVINRGWGVRFPMAGWGGERIGVTLVYMPESEEDLKVVQAIVKAGVAWMTGTVVA